MFTLVKWTQNVRPLLSNLVPKLFSLRTEPYELPFPKNIHVHPGFTYLSLRESKRRTCQVKELEEKGFLDNGQTFLPLMDTLHFSNLKKTT